MRSRMVAGHPCLGNFLEPIQTQPSSTESCQTLVKVRSCALFLGIRECWGKSWPLAGIVKFHPGLQGSQTLLCHSGTHKKGALEYEESLGIHTNSAIQLYNA